MVSEDIVQSASTPIPRTNAEWEAFAAATHYARAHDLSLPAEAPYLDVLEDARNEILRRLVRGLLRGRPSGLPEAVLVSPEPLTVPDNPAPLSELRGEQLGACLRPFPEECRSVALLPFPASKTVVIAPITAIHGYDRYRFIGAIRRWSPDASPDDPPFVEHPNEVVPLIQREGAFTNAIQADKIQSELSESVANLALAQLAGPVHAAVIDPTTKSALNAVASGLPAADPSAAFERIVTDGHPFHPAAKIRREMSASEGLTYAPEFTDRIDLRFVAVRRDFTLEREATGVDRLTDRLLATVPGLETAFARVLPSGNDLADYAVLPVHPWQYYHTIQDRYADQQDDNRVIPLPEFTHPATPQLNLRTVVPYGTKTTSGPLPHFKLAIGVQTTNVVRTLSPQAVTNGPQVTDILTAIDKMESFERLGLLAESAATCYYEPGGPHIDGEPYDDARHLSGLLRLNPYAHALVPDEAQPVVASSLLATAPTTGRPLVCECIEQYAKNTGTTSTTDAALAFVDAYAAVAIPEQLLLLCKYGIALESHLQNSLVVFDDARPIATLVRDFGGIRIHSERLADHGISIEPYPDSDIDTDAVADLHQKLYYALFQNHLAELIATITNEMDADEAACWLRIREQCEQAFDRLRSDPAVPRQRVRRDEAALFDDPIVHKALTAMRLQGKRHEYVTSDVSNPLAAKDRQSIDTNR